MFTEVEGSLSGKKIALFGSYGWGSGEWMADWEERSKAAGAVPVSYTHLRRSCFGGIAGA